MGQKKQKKKSKPTSPGSSKGVEEQINDSISVDASPPLSAVSAVATSPEYRSTRREDHQIHVHGIYTLRYCTPSNSLISITLLRPTNNVSKTII